MDRGAWRATVMGSQKSQMWLSTQTQVSLVSLNVQRIWRNSGPSGTTKLFLETERIWLTMPPTSGGQVMIKDLGSNSAVKTVNLMHQHKRIDIWKFHEFQSLWCCNHRCCGKSFQSCLTLCDPMDCSLPGCSVHGDSPGKNTRVGCRALLQGIFPTHGLNPSLLYCRQILYYLSHQGSPNILMGAFKN